MEVPATMAKDFVHTLAKVRTLRDEMTMILAEAEDIRVPDFDDDRKVVRKGNGVVKPAIVAVRSLEYQQREAHNE